MIYYLAYGSNLNKEQMKVRCPNSKPIGTMLLKGYELTFKAFLTVERKKDAVTPVGIWQVSCEDEKRLDNYEGYPRHYRKEYIKIKVDGKVEKALIYIMNNIREITPPSIHYYNVCSKGYKDFGFDESYLSSALSRSIDES